MTQPTRTVDFWFEFASTYSYPAAMTVEAEARARRVALRWQPFLLGPIFAEAGMRDSPFNLHAAKGAYMWRDMARICEGIGLAFHRPDPFPQHSVLAARTALVGADAPWGPAFVRAVYHAEFAEGAPISDPAVIARALREAGADPDAALAEADSPETKARLRAQVAEAQGLGVFGAPSFTVGPELFWGHDRMAPALDLAATGPG